jgi:hypothetical protein
MNSNNFEKDLRIDPTQLDVESLRHPEITFKWARRSAKAEEELEQAKLNLEVVEASKSSEIRRNPKLFGIMKVSEAAIKAATILSPSSIKAKREFIAALKRKKLLDAAVRAIEVKKSSIEFLIRLHGQQYFAGPRVPRNLAELWTKSREEISKNVMERQKKRIKEQR